ncbi:MAG: ATP cone domain-containing protein, partial [Oscillospiraceae bacterium]|nr:ATP cone domain-containing protein [Oscillospiraceae bacterium]
MVLQKLEQIQKRDGRSVTFNTEKIADAIFKAAESVGGQDYAISTDLAEKVCDLLDKQYAERGVTPSVEGVQDVVEKVLVETGHASTAKAYILYRAERTRVREMGTRLMKIYEDLTFKSSGECDIKRENANIDGDTAMGTMLKYGSEGAKQFYEMFVLKPEHAKAHREGDIHIHDLDFYTLTTTCCQIDIAKLFEDGFSTGHGTLREPNHIASYTALCCIAIQSNQNDQHGGQSVYNFDYGMARGVAKTYVHTYRDNILRALELLAGIEDPAIQWPEVKPAMSGNPIYDAEELALLEELAGSLEIAGKVQAFARRRAEKETDHTTYKAMVAFIHNLNTMHSRAGAQIP